MRNFFIINLSLFQSEKIGEHPEGNLKTVKTIKKISLDKKVIYP